MDLRCSDRASTRAIGVSSLHAKHALACVFLAIVVVMPACAYKREPAATLVAPPETAYTHRVWDRLDLPEVHDARLLDEIPDGEKPPDTYITLRPVGAGVEATRVIRLTSDERAYEVTIGDVDQPTYVWTRTPPHPLPRGDVVVTYAPDDDARSLSDAADAERSLAAIEGDLRETFHSASLRIGWVALPPTTRAEGGAAGLAIALPPLGGFEHVTSTIRELRARGLLVMYPNGYTVNLGERGNAGRAGLPITRTVTNQHFEMLGSSTDEFLAAMALQAEAAASIAHRDHPYLADKPTAVVGFSLGAISTPTAIARLEAAGHMVDAAVLVGGGVDFARIAATSSLDIFSGDEWRALRRAEQRDLDAVAAAAIEHRPFDPYHTAPRLAGRPVLVVHASRDRIVPARLGDELWQRLGKPERWTHPGGHLQLFWSLDRIAGALADWVAIALGKDTEIGKAADAESGPSRNLNPASGQGQHEDQVEATVSP